MKPIAMSTSLVSAMQLSAFEENGFIALKSLFSATETAALVKAALNESAPAYKRPGFENAALSSWFSPENNIFGYVARSEKIINTVAELITIKEPVCHVQSKIMDNKRTDASGPGWQQDYAFWKTNDFISSGQMVTVVIALTPTTINNGAFKIIKGSHKLPTLKHTMDLSGQYEKADAVQVQHLMQKNDVVNIELEVGDAVFLHSNVLHCAGENLPAETRLSAIYCYSSVSNRKTKGFFTSWYTPIEVMTQESVFTPSLRSSNKKSPAQPQGIA